MTPPPLIWLVVAETGGKEGDSSNAGSPLPLSSAAGSSHGDLPDPRKGGGETHRFVGAFVDLRTGRWEHGSSESCPEGIHQVSGCFFVVDLTSLHEHLVIWGFFMRM